MSLWLIPAAASLVGGVVDYKAGQDMEDLAYQEARMVEENKALASRELAETVRRQKREDAMALGAATARAAASGARVSGTAAGYLEFIEQEQIDNIDWMKESGESRIDLDYRAGMMGVESSHLQADSKKAGLFTGIIGAASFMGKGGLFDGSTK